MAAAMLAPTPPTSSPVTFEEYLAVTTNDHYIGNYDALLQNFSIDGVNAAANLSPAQVRAQVVEATAQRRAVCLVALIDDRLHAFFLPFTIKPALGMVEDLTVHNKMHAFHEEVVNGNGILVHVPDDYFNQAARVQVPTLATAKALLAADPTLNSFGPFNVGDPDTTTARTRLTCVLPATYVRYLLSDENGVHPRKVLEELQPVIEADGNAASLEVFTTFVISAMTNTTVQATQAAGPSAVQVAMPAPVARNTALLTHSQRLLHSHLTGLGNTGGGGVNFTPLITAINDGHLAAATRASDERQDRKSKEIKTVESMLGKEHLAHILRLCGVTVEAELSPLWASMAGAPNKSSRLVILQTATQQEFLRQNLLHEHYLPGLSFLNDCMNMIWASFGDSLEGGSVANPFLFTETSQEAFHSRNNQLQLIMSGTASPSLADAQALLKNKITIPGPEESVSIIRRWAVLLRVLFPIGHPLTVYLIAHLEEMKSFEQPWTNYMTHEPSKYRLKGFYHLRFLQLKVVKFITAINQGRHIPVLDPSEIPDAIQAGIRWEPIVTPAFSARYHLDHFAQLHPPGGPPGAIRSPQFPHFTPTGGGPTLPVAPASVPPTPTPPGVAIPPLNPTNTNRGRDDSSVNRTVNTSFNAVLFNTYKISSLKCKALRDRIDNNTLVALPKSKVDITRPMCLAWHTKGQCNVNCPCASDHVQYSASEYAPLAEWCVIGYAPLPAQAP